MRTLPTCFTLVLALAVLIAPGGQAQSAQGAAKAPAGMAVSVTTPRSEQFARTVVATGSVYAWQEAVIGPEVGGYRVAEVRVDVGDKVRKGQELVRLADEMLAAEVASKKAAKAQADAQLITASSNLRRAESLEGSGAVSAHGARAPEERRSRRARASGSGRVGSHRRGTQTPLHARRCAR